MIHTLALVTGYVVLMAICVLVIALCSAFILGVVVACIRAARRPMKYTIITKKNDD